MVRKKLFPVLSTERLYLRQLSHEDADDVFRYFSRDEVMEYYDLYPFRTVEEAVRLIDRWNGQYEEQAGIRWGIARKEDNKIIGSCGFHNWSQEHFKAEIGYELAPEYWNQGFMTEAVFAGIHYGFEQLSLNRIEAFIDPRHTVSRKLLHKAGFRTEGTLRQCFYEKGRFVDAEILSLLKHEPQEQ